MKKHNLKFKKTGIILLSLVVLFTNLSYAANIIWAPTHETEQTADSAIQLPGETMKIYAPTAERVQSDAIITPGSNVAPSESNVINEAILIAESIDNDNIYNVVENGNNYMCYNPDGTAVKNGWRKISIYSFAEFAPVYRRHGNYVWMYFGPSGRAIKGGTSVKRYEINGKTYAFNEYGEMLVGFFNNQGDVWDEEENREGPFELIGNDNDDLYYADASGVLHTGWLKVENTKEELYPNKVFLWLYFKPGVFRAVRSTGNNYKSEKINGKNYAFDDLGIMLTGFEAYQYNETHGGNTSRVVYFADDGHEITNGFVNVDIWDDSQNYIVEDIDSDMYDDEDVIVYMNRTGKMYRDEMKKIGNYYYGFDDNGVVVRGLSVWNGKKFVATINVDDTNGKDFIITGNYKDKRGNNNVLGSGDKVYYFDSNGHRQGNAKIDFSDETYTFAGNNNGGYDGVDSKKYYSHGLLLRPIDEKYGVIVRNSNKTNYTMQEICGGAAVVVTSTGQTISGTTAHKDDNDYYWLTQNGALLNVYNVNVRHRNGKYEFKSQSKNGKEEWIAFGEKDYYGRTCVTASTPNGTRLSDGAISSYQVKIERASALNFYLN